jgi:hypothetical protein
MEKVSPFKIFNTWLWDGNINSPIPKGEVDILKYNSPITHTYIISLFLRHGPLNNYLNNYFNNMGVRYLDKKDLFFFIKKCVMDFRIRKGDLIFYQYKKEKLIYSKLRSKYSDLKDNDIYLLIDLIDKSLNKESIYQSLGLDTPKKQKIKLTKKEVKNNSLSLETLLKEHFSFVKT